MEALRNQLQKLCDHFKADATIVVKDLGTQEKIDIRGDERFYVASIIKMWFLWAVLYERTEG